MRRLAIVLLIAAALACRRAEPPPVETKRSVPEVENLLALARGASVVSRTGELSLETSAVRLIDGDPATPWRSPPGGAWQTFVFSLAAPTRVTRVGMRATAFAHETPERVTFELSGDGATWREVASVPPGPPSELALTGIEPTDARYVRVTTIEPSEHYATINGLHVVGTELAPPDPPRIDGCWTINGRPARFVQRGAAVAGVIGGDTPTLVSGGSDGRVIRLMWLRGPQWGVALLATDPPERTLSGVRWHERVDSESSGDGWFGEKAECSGGIEVDAASIARSILGRAGRWTLYAPESAETAAALIAAMPEARFRLTAPEASLLESVTAALRTHGVDPSRFETALTPPTATAPETERVIGNGVELHVRR